MSDPTDPIPRAIRRVLVTGAAGTIGVPVCDLLAAEGIAVTGLSLSGPFPASVDRIVLGDVTASGDVDFALDGVDAVVHLAAIPHPAHASPQRVFSTNVTGTFTVLATAGERGIRRAVIASSINAFGVPMNRARPMPAYFPLDEDLPVDIDDPYSLSKHVDESTARMAWRRWGITSVALRFPLTNELRHLVSASGHATAQPEHAMREAWSYLDVRDAARAVHAALVAPIIGAHVIGLTADDTLIDRPTSELLAEYAPGVPVRRDLIGTEPAVDRSRATDLIGFRPRYSVHDGSRSIGGGAPIGAPIVTALDAVETRSE